MHRQTARVITRILGKKARTMQTTVVLTPDQSRAVAKEAYIYGFPMVDSYRIQHAYFVDRENPEYKTSWNQLLNTPRVYTPDDKTVQTPNSDTPYSMIGMDLRAEPLVITVPPMYSAGDCAGNRRSCGWRCPHGAGDRGPADYI